MKETRSSLKVAVMLGLMLLVICIFNTNTVNATTYGYVASGTPTTNSLDCISDTLTFDMKTTKLETLEEHIYNQVVNTLKEDGIIIGEQETDFTLSIELAVPFTEEENPYIEKVVIGIYDNKNHKFIAEKNVTINWDNKNNYNETDKEYVKNLVDKLSITGKEDLDEFDFKYSMFKELGKTSEGLSVEEFALKMLKDKTNDANLEFIKLPMGEGGDIKLGFTNGYAIPFSIFKNGVWYGWINQPSFYCTQITVPASIEDSNEAYIKYALPKIKEHLKEGELSNILDIETTTLTNDNGYYYTVSVEGVEGDYEGTYTDRIVIKKAEGTPLGNNIYVDNLEEKADITVTVKENTKMTEEVKSKGYSNILGSYELKLDGITKLTNPIDITFNVGTEHNGKMAYVLHQKQDGTYENFEVKVVDGKVTVTVSELSPFVVALKSETKPETKPDTTPETKPEEPKKEETTTPEHIKDETPKTGTNNIISVVSSILAVVSLGGMAIIKKH